jgi:lipopolysaccharide/colanic/teichoic acid biosynthesis glycosyltransferase
MLTKREKTIKRAFDVVAAALGLAVLWPLLLAIAALVRWESPGGVLFRGIRTGKNGRPFRIYKFRTMVPDAERIGGGSTAKDDPRVTRWGGVLRKYKLDELPQLLNVLIGDMSIVGPRPELPKYTRLYENDERVILRVRPGITDYASLELFHLSEILGSSDADRVYEEKVNPVKKALRVKYVNEQTLAGDLWIVLRTLRRVCHL